jgi:hypothetical protein
VRPAGKAAAWHLRLPRLSWAGAAAGSAERLVAGVEVVRGGSGGGPQIRRRLSRIRWSRVWGARLCMGRATAVAVRRWWWLCSTRAALRRLSPAKMATVTAGLCAGVTVVVCVVACLWPWLAAGGDRGCRPLDLAVLGHGGLEGWEPEACCV